MTYIEPLGTFGAVRNEVAAASRGSSGCFMSSFYAPKGGVVASSLVYRVSDGGNDTDYRLAIYKGGTNEDEISGAKRVWASERLSAEDLPTSGVALWWEHPLDLDLEPGELYWIVFQTGPVAPTQSVASPDHGDLNLGIFFWSSASNYLDNGLPDTAPAKDGNTNASQSLKAYIKFGSRKAEEPVIIRRPWTKPANTGSYAHDSEGDNTMRISALVPEWNTAWTGVGGATICMWAKPYVEAASPTYRALFSASSTQTGAISHTFEYNGSADRWGWYESADRILMPLSSHPPGKWAFVAVSKYDGGGIGTYMLTVVDGKPYYNTGTWNPANQGDWITLFSLPNAGDNAFWGQGCGLKLWARSFSPGHMLREMQSYEPVSKDGLIGWWPLDRDYGFRCANNPRYNLAPTASTEPSFVGDSPPLMKRAETIYAPEPVKRRVVTF